MKKIIGIVGVVAFAMVMFMNINISSADSNSKFSDLTLQSLVKYANAQAECTDCIPVECPWWNPLCEDGGNWDKSDKVESSEQITYNCWRYVRDCYPGTSTCQELTWTTCV